MTCILNEIPEYAERQSGAAMQTAKQEVAELLDHLPDDTSFEDIQYHLYVLEKIKRGQADIAQGRSYSHKEAKQRLSRWLKV